MRNVSYMEYAVSWTLEHIFLVKTVTFNKEIEKKSDCIHTFKWKYITALPEDNCKEYLTLTESNF